MLRVYIAYHVDEAGVTQANYRLAATDDEKAREEARRYLVAHKSIDVWNGSRQVAHLLRE
jgi:hypothetical protein